MKLPNTRCLILFTLLFFTSLTLIAQKKLSGYIHWPAIHKEYKNSIKAKSPPAPHLFTASTYADTGAFTVYPADLPGVIEGNGAWIDYDNDGDLDILISGWDDSKPITKFFRNDNGTFTEVDIGVPGVVTEHGVAWGDFDNDGDYDLAITGLLDSGNYTPVTRIYRNDNGTFSDIHAPLVNVLGGVAKWVDYDLDGRLDLLVSGSPDQGSSFVTKLYHNDDSMFTESGIYFPGVWGASVSWGDYDNDGDPDLLLFGYGTWGVTGTLWRNDKSTFTQVGIPSTPVNACDVSWGDYDNDGKLDFIVTGDPPGWGDGNTYTALYHCTDIGNFEFVPTNLPLLNLASAAWGDYDNDGYLDLAMCGWLNDSTNVTKIFHNDGNGVFTDIGANLTGVLWGSVAWGDVDNDGRLDLLVTGGARPQPYRYNQEPFLEPLDVITVIYHNNTTTANQKPTGPVNLSSTVSGSSVTFSWDAAVDDRTPQSMLTYDLRVGTAPGVADIVSPSSNLTTGFRRVPMVGNNVHKLSRTIQLPRGKYYWSVQSVDNGYAASSFAAEKIVNPTTTGTPAQQPAYFALGQNYPNPFNPSTSISYQLPTNSFVTLKVYNVLGQEIQTLISGIQDAGPKSLQWNGENFASGIYLYRLSAVSLQDKNDSYLEVKKMVLIK